MAMPSYGSVMEYITMLSSWIIENYVIVVAFLAAVSGIVVISLVMKRRKTESVHEKEKKHASLTPPPPPENVKSDYMIGIVRGLESEIDNIDAENLGDDERLWYNKIKMEIESIKKNLAMKDVSNAKRHLGSLELYMKTLELRMESR